MHQTSSINSKFYSKLVWTLFLYLNFSGAAAQQREISVKWGELDTLVRAHLSKVNLFDDEAGGVFVFKRKFKSGPQKEITIAMEHYDSEFELIQATDLKIVDARKKLKPEQVFSWNKKLYAVYAKRSRKRVEFFAREIDRSNMSLLEEKIPLADWDQLKNGQQTELLIKYSPDSSKVLMVVDPFMNVDKNRIFGFTMFDRTLHPQWRRQVVIPRGERLLVRNIQISNNGRICLLGSMDGLYSLFLFTDSVSSFLRHSIKGLFSSVQIQIRGNEVFGAGFYSKANTMGTSGVYMLNMDLNLLRVNVETYTPFDSKFVLQRLGKLDLKWALEYGEQDKAPELYWYALDKILPTENGDILLIGEQRFRYSTPPTRSPQNVLYAPGVSSFDYSATSTVHYAFNDIIALKLTYGGEIVWTRKIPKSQGTMNDGGLYSSYFSSSVDGRPYFLFNDTPKNMLPAAEIRDDLRPEEFTGSKSILALVSVDSKTGESLKYWISNLMSVYMTIIPRECQLMPNGDLILFGERGRHQQFGKLKLR